MFFIDCLHASSFRVSEDDYIKAIKEEISKVVKLQEEFDIDVLVHGEPEVISPPILSLLRTLLQYKNLGNNSLFTELF